ncbi:MAG TPA: hypothetical protein DCR43_03895 [Bacteroidales bacterium]|nr:MAG: hypothetical protein A2X11_00590 [Bacteroidetes bacterium GWE2_42_24]OFY27535.1 MAG: hypothetical protein A2X09_07635 [Bacteroidetes bacterium GWF2_43_11]HAQ64985.1 hypothetical protein [Bacteroidales bacterium]HBZ66058.1 hypothetical protein [Bacteroidales bacterium]
MVNYHTHTYFCDGSDHPAEYAMAALSAGLTELGFSGHAPVPFSNGFAIPEDRLSAYCEEILELRQLFEPALKIWLGLEIDYIPGVTRPFDTFRKYCNLDFVIGSVHLVKARNNDNFWFIDGPEKSKYDDGLLSCFGNDIRAAVTAYYSQVIDMVINENPDIVGHCDKIRMHNAGRYFTGNEDWYQLLIDEMLQAVKEKEAIIEVNSRGLYKKRSDDFFPATTVLKKIKELNIPITLSSDAHRPEEIALGLIEAQTLVESMGFKPANTPSLIKCFV